MTVAEPTETVPLHTDADGVIRVGGTRVTLETVVSVFDAGSTPEEICEDFPSLTLPDVYAVVTYVLRNRQEIEQYLVRRQEEAQEIRREIEASPANRRLREKLLARREA